MIRVTLLEFMLVATPFLLFFLYRVLVNAQNASSDQPIDETPYQILFFVGAAGALAALVVVVLTREAPSNPRDLVYVPSHSENGEVVAGHFITREDAIARGLVAPRGGEAESAPESADDADGDPPA